MRSINKAIILVGSGIVILAITFGFRVENKNPYDHDHIKVCGQKGCTFRTLFGEESSMGYATLKTEAGVQHSVDKGLSWLVEAQQNDGGWGAGSHSRQNVLDPHAVQTDPATTAMVGLALLRSGSTPKKGPYSRQINDALDYLLHAVESTPTNRYKITELSGTQIQTKLGENIDAVLAAQFFNNILEFELPTRQMETRVRESLEACVSRIQSRQNADGSLSGDGWAGVLQSSLANNVLEAAAANDIDIDQEAMERSREFQEKNYDTETGKVATDRGAGVVLYSVSGSVRASAKQARKAEQELQKAKERGDIPASSPVTQETLEDAGLSRDEAAKLVTSYNVYQESKKRAQQEDVLTGFGNNGGEEFISFLQTGESMVIAGGDDWKKWYDNTSGRILSIQNEDGSWNGHHCITSPVFCTATCLLILTIEQDIERLQNLADL